jgi:hypothetical protein
VRCAVAVGATVISLLGTSVLASAPASASVSSSGATATDLPTIATAGSPAPGCPELPIPVDEGGIGSIYPLIPIFGPFSSEAFVWLPLLQTLVPSVAPLLPLAELGLVTLQPEINLLLPVIEDLEESGYAVIGPQYAPYRQEVLNAEQQLVDLLLPLAQEGATLPGSACLAPIEGIIVSELDESAAAGTLG